MGATNQIIQSFFTTLFENVSFQPFFETLKARIAKVLSWTSDVGIPLLTDAKSKRDAVITEIIEASTLPISTISVPVFTISLRPNIELPIPKEGAIIKVARIMISTKLPLVGFICNSLVIIEAIGPEALATLFDPIEKAT